MADPVDIHRLRPRRGALWELVTVDLSRKPATPATDFPEPPDETGGTFTSGRGLDLAIDFGTSAIVVALVGAHAFEVLRMGDEKILPSPFGRRRRLDRSRLTDNYELSYAYLGGGDREHEYYPCLKRRIEWLARCREDREWEGDAILDVAAVCQLALEKARDPQGRSVAERLDRDFATYITVPNAFPSSAIDVLRRGVAYGVAAALDCQRLPVVKSLLEAEAVAYGEIAGPSLAERRRRTTLLVIDAGAGTTDATILRAEDNDLRALSHVGLPVGGMDLDTFLASLKGPFDVAESQGALSQWLGTAREAKQHHLGETPVPAGAPAAGVPFADRCRGLADHLVRHGDWPARRGGRPIADDIARVYQRYMALAVRCLIRALPAEEVSRIDQVVLSGRASLLTGFRDTVRQTLAEHGPTLEPRCDEAAEDRKLAVVKGVGAYVASTYGSGLDRRPTRSSFEIFLRHGSERELTLLKAGHPLVQGWGVAAWHQPRREMGRSPTRPWVGMRLIPREVLKSLASENAFEDKDLENLLQWSELPLLRIEEQRPPYSTRFAFNFLSLEAQLEVDGRPIPHLDRAVKSFGRRHPVHQLDDNWFELSGPAPSTAGVAGPRRAAGRRSIGAFR